MPELLGLTWSTGSSNARQLPDELWRMSSASKVIYVIVEAEPEFWPVDFYAGVLRLLYSVFSRFAHPEWQRRLHMLLDLL